MFNGHLPLLKNNLEKPVCISLIKPWQNPKIFIAILLVSKHGKVWWQLFIFPTPLPWPPSPLVRVPSCCLLLCGLHLVHKLWVHDWRFDGPAQALPHPLTSFPSPPLTHLIDWSKTIHPLHYSITGEARVAQGRRITVGCRLFACLPTLHGVLPVLFSWTMVSIAEQMIMKVHCIYMFSIEYIRICVFWSWWWLGCIVFIVEQGLATNWSINFFLFF